MKVGDLITVIYTKGCSTPPIVGLIADTASNSQLRWRIKVLINGGTFWMDEEDLEVTNESR
jgi:hypothetical protein